MSARRRIALVALGALALGFACQPKDKGPAQPPKAAPEEPAFDNPGGMWMPTQMAAHKATLEKLGLAFDPAALGDPTSFPLGAVVSLGGCSASFVSDEGLVVTNHHCVIGALQNNSTPDKNLLETGFVASSKADERPAGQSQRIFVTMAMTDVTTQVTQGLDAITDPNARYQELAQRTRKLDSECEAAKPGHACDVKSFFEGAEYWLVDALEIRDVRLVYAPHAGIGVFGGEVDNWRWPRHTGDFAFLRAYVGPDGQPADPSTANVPYKPPHRLKVASTPLMPGDFVMVAGYPGRTNRLSTSGEVRDAIQYRYPRDIERYGQTLALLEQIGKDRPELAIKAASRIRRLANYHTNFKGMLEGLQRGGLADQKLQQETELRTWIEADEARKKKYGDVLGELAALDDLAKQNRDRDAVLKELPEASVPLGAAIALVQALEHAGQPGTPAPEELQRTLENQFRNYDLALDRAMLELALARAAKLPDGVRPDDVLVAILGAKPPYETAAISAAVDKLSKKSKLGDPRARAKLFATKSIAALEKNRDPYVKVALALRDAYRQYSAREEARAGALAVVRPRFVAALREHSKIPIAPDANSTLRITYGTVKGYKPAPDAQPYEPFTTLSQMLEKNTGADPFALPQSIVTAAQGDKGKYVAAELGDVPLDFLADLDITGGNSGSATLNAKGELVGLAFDGNYEAIASNWLFLPGITRSIHVDVRFMLWVLDAVDEADHLLVEMGVQPSIGGAKPSESAPITVPAPPADEGTTPPAAATPPAESATPPRPAANG
jgi:hypothetical protein